MNIVSQRYNTALVNGGVFVYVPKNVEAEHPVQYVVLHDDEKMQLVTSVIIVTAVLKSHMLKITIKCKPVSEIN